MVQVRHLGPADPAADEVGDHVHPAELGLDGSDDRPGRDRIREVARHGEHSTGGGAQLGGGRREAGRVGAVERDPGPVGQEPACDGAAGRAGGARDEDGEWLRGGRSAAHGRPPPSGLAARRPWRG